MKTSAKYIFLFLLTLVFTAGAQTYTHPTTGMAGEFIGACMTTTCSGTYTDDNGGGGGNYTNGVNNIYRTFCPNTAGMCMRVCFNSINMAVGNCVPGNVPCDILNVLNGPTQNSPLINEINYQDNGTTPCYTATGTSGCLTFRFRSVIGGAAGWSATLSCSSCAANTIADNNDCIAATAICSNASFTGASVGPGIASEGCSGCNTSEHFSNWYRFCAQTTGALNLTIDPAVNTQDYDFALYGPNTTCTSLGSPVRCSYAAVTGNTGLRAASVDVSENVAGDGWVSTLNVTAGQCYYMMVSQWSAGGSGFTIDFTGTTASLNCTILPVELVHFDVIKQGEAAQLDWVTMSEVNNDYFVVERSRDNILYSAVRVLDGQGNSTEATWYSALDENPFPGISYYRLKQVDYDGEFSYSDVKSFTIEHAGKLVVLPTENGNQVNILFNAQHSGAEQLFVYDFSGRMVFSKNISFMHGFNSVKLDMSDLSRGMYFLSFAAGEEIYKAKFIR